MHPCIHHGQVLLHDCHNGCASGFGGPTLVASACDEEVFPGISRYLGGGHPLLWGWPPCLVGMATLSCGDAQTKSDIRLHSVFITAPTTKPLRTRVSVGSCARTAPTPLSCRRHQVTLTLTLTLTLSLTLTSTLALWHTRPTPKGLCVGCGWSPYSLDGRGEDACANTASSDPGRATVTRACIAPTPLHSNTYHPLTRNR